MLRFLLRRIPRFGFLTLFTAMLLFVSLAGWAKWHLDLWREEEALLSDLAKAGVDYSYVRGSGVLVESKPRWTQPWSLWHWTPPMLSRIDSIHLQGSAPRELLERAATLPYVADVSGEEGPRTFGGTPMEAIVGKAGFDLQPLAPPIISARVDPLPRGERVEGDEAKAGLARLTHARTAITPPPTRGTSHVAMATPSAWKRFYARDAAVRFCAHDDVFAVTSPWSHETFMCEGSTVQQRSRLDDVESTREMFGRMNPPLVIFDEQTYLESNLRQYGVEALFTAALDTPAEVHVERIDERRVRFDLPPIVRKFAAADCEDSVLISLIARSDLDWQLEAWDMQASRAIGAAPPPNLPPIASAYYRGTLRREGEWIVAEEWTADRLAGPVTPAVPGFPVHLIAVRYAATARYDFTSDVHLSHVTPERFDAKMLPPPRTLPWLRWYHVTFTIGAALFGIVFVRDVAGRRKDAASSM